jgi:hypothetical protein
MMDGDRLNESGLALSELRKAFPLLLDPGPVLGNESDSPYDQRDYDQRNDLSQDTPSGTSSHAAQRFMLLGHPSSFGFWQVVNYRSSRASSPGNSSGPPFRRAPRKLDGSRRFPLREGGFEP